MSKNYIIMADIISSGKKPSRSLMNDFKYLVHSANTEKETVIISPLTITLGDEFQGVCTTVAGVIDVILYFEEQIIRQSKNFRLRYVVHYGLIETPINTITSYEMLGPGLSHARKILNQKRRGAPRTIFELESKKQSRLLTELFIVLDDISTNSFPSRNREYLSDFLFDELTDTQIAKKHNRTRSEIWKFRNNWNIQSYSAILKILRERWFEHGVN